MRKVCTIRCVLAMQNGRGSSLASVAIASWSSSRAWGGLRRRQKGRALEDRKTRAAVKRGSYFGATVASQGLFPVSRKVAYVAVTQGFPPSPAQRSFPILPADTLPLTHQPNQ